MSNNLDDILKKIITKIDLPEIPKIDLPEIPKIDFSDMSHALHVENSLLSNLPEIINPIDETNDLLYQHLNIAKEQNKLLRTSLEQTIQNYQILKEHYDLQLQANKDNEKNIRRNKIISFCSIGIAVIGIIIGAII